jgi:hypothetical protein
VESIERYSEYRQGRPGPPHSRKTLSSRATSPAPATGPPAQRHSRSTLPDDTASPNTRRPTSSPLAINPAGSLDAGSQCVDCSAQQVAVDLRLLTSHGLDVIHDRVRAINRLRATILEYFSALERAFDFSKNKAALILLAGYATPDSLRRIGVTRLTTWLKGRGCRNSTRVAQIAVDAARTQTTTLPAQAIGAPLVAKLAARITTNDEDLAQIDAEITTRISRDDKVQLLLSMPGLGAVPAATFRSAATSAPSTGSPASLASPQFHTTLDVATATSTGHTASIVGCCEPAISQRCRASRTAPHPGPFHFQSLHKLNEIVYSAPRFFKKLRFQAYPEFGFYWIGVLRPALGVCNCRVPLLNC